jgi:hypothetical protein
VIALWMFYACVLGALLGGAALALERLAVLRRLATRWIWFGALVATCAVPVGLAVIPEAAPLDAGALSVGRMELGLGVASIERVAPSPGSRTSVSFHALTKPMLAFWGSATMLLLGILLHGGLSEHRVRRRWRRTVLDGTPVLVAPDAGPAVIGVWRLRIVLPEWAVSGEPTALRLMLQHEEQHVRARDPNLLQLAAAFLVLMPWNVALWWLVRRLRLAVELDCDRRVLRVGQDAHAYGTLLIDVGTRYAAAVLLPGAAFSESSSHLARRIEAMTAPSPRRPWLHACAFGAVAVAAVVVACAAPRPEPIRPAAATDRLFPPLEVRRPRVTPEQPYTREQMTAAIGRYFPEVLRGDTGTLPLRFVLGTDGRVVSTSRGRLTAPLYPWNRIESGRNEDVGAGYYGPAPVRVEVVWLKPDSLLGESGSPSGVVLTTVESTGPYPDTLGRRLEQQARNAFSTHVALMSGLQTADTAYLWFVLSASGAVVRAGRAPTSAAMRAGAHLASPGAYFVKSYPKGEIAPWMVVITAAWEKP